MARTYAQRMTGKRAGKKNGTGEMGPENETWKVNRETDAGVNTYRQSTREQTTNSSKWRRSSAIIAGIKTKHTL